MLRRLGTALLFLFCAVLGLLIHLPSVHGRGSVRDIANAILARQFLGHLHLGSVDVLSPRRGLFVSNVTLRDQQDRLVIERATLSASTLTEVFRSLLGRANAQMPSLTLHATALHLIFDGGNTPSIAPAFDPPTRAPRTSAPPSTRPSAPKAPFVLRFPAIRLAVDHITIDHTAFVSTIDRAIVDTSIVTDPVRIRSSLDNATVAHAQYGVLQASAHFGLDIPRQNQPPVADVFSGTLHADAALRGAEIDCSVSLDVDQSGTHISTRDCVARAPLLSRIIGSPIRLDAAIHNATFAVQPSGALALSASVSIGAEPVQVVLTGMREELHATVRVSALDLSRIDRTLPSSSATGEVQFVRRGNRIEVDTTGLLATVGGVQIPPLRGRAELTPDTLRIEDLDVPALGLRAHGSVALRDPTHPIDVQAEGSVQNADAVPMLRQFGISGALRYSAHVRRRDGLLSATYTARGRSLVIPGGIRASSANISGDFERSDAGAIRTHTRAQVAGFSTAGFGPLDGTVEVDGNPLDRLNGTFRVNADRVAAIGGDALRGHTDSQGHFTIRRRADGVEMEVADTRVEVRGAVGRLHASVRVRRGQRPIISASLRTDEGATADVIVDGGGVHANLTSLSLAWLSRAIGLKRPLDGVVTGTLGMHQQHPTGSIEWTGGTLPVLGAVALHLESSAQENVDHLQARLQYGDARGLRPEITVDIRARTRSIHAANIREIIQSVDAIDVRASRTPVAILQQFLPRGVVLSGGGDVEMTASRAEPGGPLEGRLAFDVRHAQVGASVEAALAQGLFGRVLANGAIRARPLTVPFRLRGALCATMPLSVEVPQRTDFALAFGSDSPLGEIELPRSCSAEDSRFATAMVQTEGETSGPWFRGVELASNELTSFRGSGKTWNFFHWSEQATTLLAAAAVNVSIQAGPLTNDSWPFTVTAGRLLPALARPNLPGTIAVQTRIDGPMLRPTIHTNARIELTSLDWIEADRQASVDLSFDIAAANSELPLLQRALLDLDAQLNIRSPIATDEPVRAVFELRTVLDPREVVEGTDAIQHVDIERLSARTTSFDLGSIPWARRNRVSGRLALSLTDTDNADRPLLLNASIREWRVRDQGAANVAFRAGIFNACTLPGPRDNCATPRWETKSCFTVSPGDQGAAGCDPTELADNTPIGGLRVVAGAPFEGHWKRAQLLFSKLRVGIHSVNFPIETISPLLETGPIVRVSGELTAGLGWSAEQPRSINGNLFLHHGELTLERMGMPLRDIDLSLAAAGRRIYFSPELTLSMGSGNQRGTVTAEGLIDLAGSQGELARVVLRPVLDNLPAVQEGNLFAQITGSFAFDSRVYRDHMDATLAINRATLQIPEDSSRSLQALDDAYGVFVMGRSLVSRPAQSRTYTTRIEFRTQEPIVLRRRDFLIGVRAEGWLRYASSMAVGGTVDLAGAGNFFELFGKRFTIERLGILLDGSSSLDPLLDVALRYESPSDGRINILVGGRKSAPEIRFTAERYPGASEAEILAILILGRRESRGATDQAAIETQGRQAAVSLLAGILYGLGAGQIQRVVESTGFGFVPTLIAEPGADGTGLSRLGVGVLPSFFGNRVYIEGTANFNALSGNGGQVLVDATISEHLSLGAIWNQSQTTGQRFGVDFFVVP